VSGDVRVHVGGTKPLVQWMSHPTYAQTVTGRVRTITDADMTDGTEHMASLRLSDEELAERGIDLSDEGYVQGLGPTRARYVELPSGEQFCFVRFEFRRDLLEIAVFGQIPCPLAASLDALLVALKIPPARITWKQRDKQWADIQQRYDRSRWLRQMAEWSSDNDETRGE